MTEVATAQQEVSTPVVIAATKAELAIFRRAARRLRHIAEAWNLEEAAEEAAVLDRLDISGRYGESIRFDLTGGDHD